MKLTYWLVLSVTLLGGGQGTACSSKFNSCADSGTCSNQAAAGQPGADSVGAAGMAGAADQGGASAGEAGAAGSVGEAGAANATPVLFGRCSEQGRIACQGAASAQRLACEGTKWGAGVTCSGGALCDSSTGSCLKPVTECAGMQPGQVVCRDDKPLTCGPDLISADEASACIGACKDGVCQAPACGDKKLEGLEECDDGNLLAGDGCSPTCTWEPIAIAVGEASSCALSGGGAVKCWGDNAHGVLGLGDTDPRGVKLGQMGSKLFEVALGTKRVAKAISVSGHTACALLDAGDVKCWGNNDSGQLGTGVFEDLGDARDEMGDKLKPVALGVGRSASAVSTGGNDTCAILDDGALKCWGSGADGELGQGNGTIQPLAAPLSGIILGSNRTAKIVSAGPHFITCAVLDDAASKCWGFGETGVLPGASNLGGGEIFGIGDFPGEMAALAPLTLGSNRTVKSISVGVDFACAILDDDTAKCWGENQSGQLGRGNMQATLDDPAAVAALPVVDLGTNHKVKSISVGDHHACAVLLDGRVKCWGNNEHGQLGIGSQINQGDYPGEMGELLNAVPLGRPALQVAAGQSHTCALLDDGSIKCWGLNDSGQLGVGSTISAGDTGGLAGVVLHTVDLAF